MADRERHPAAAAEPRPAARAAIGAGEDRPGGEELLRYEPPFQLVGRYAANATQVGGHAVAAGQRVVGVVGSANRDAAVFPDHAEVLDIDRPDNGKQLGFGEGIHYCIGAPLARMVVPAALLALVQRLPGLALDGLPQWQTADPTLRALINLPLRFAA